MAVVEPLGDEEEPAALSSEEDLAFVRNLDDPDLAATGLCMYRLSRAWATPEVLRKLTAPAGLRGPSGYGSYVLQRAEGAGIVDSAP